jgi:hypothetical protein
MVHVTLHWGIGNGLTHDWQHTDDGLALDCPWIGIVATPDRGSKMMPS